MSEGTRSDVITHVCPVVVIERVERLSSKLVLQLQGVVLWNVCELVEGIRVTSVRRDRGGDVCVDDGAEVGNGVVRSNEVSS